MKYDDKTKTLLIEDLKKKPQNREVKRLMERALSGLYHDFQTPLPYPKHQLRNDLLTLGFEDLAQEVIEGRYD